MTAVTALRKGDKIAFHGFTLAVREVKYLAHSIGATVIFEGPHAPLAPRALSEGYLVEAGFSIVTPTERQAAA